MEITLQLGEETITQHLPQTWNELPPEQALTLLTVLQQSGPDVLDKRLAILVHLLGLEPYHLTDWKLALAAEYGDDWRTIFFSQISELLQATDFLLEPAGSEESPAVQLNATLTRCPVPALRLPGLSSFGGRNRNRTVRTTIELFAPADRLENISAWELALLFDTYEAYARSQPKDYSLVDKLIAILYRKSKEATPEQVAEAWYGDRRQPFNEASVPLRQSQVSHLRPDIKNLIFFWFMSCRQDIISRFENIFREGDGRERQGNDYGWWAVFRSVAGNLKDTETIAAMNHLDLLTELSFLEDERLKAEMRRAEMAV